MLAALGVWVSLDNKASDPLAEVLDIASPLEISGLEPAKSGYLFTRMQAAETLFIINRERQLVPQLVENVEVSGDGLDWRMDVRDSVMFHDGTPLTAEVVATNLRRALARPGVLQNTPIDEIAVDASSVVISLREPFALLPAFLAHYSTLMLAPSSFNEAGDITAIVGTGAYQVNEVVPPLRIELSAFDDWWQGRANIEQVRYLAVPRGETRTMMSQSGDADLTLSLPPVATEQLASDPNINLQVVTIPRTRLLKLNTAKPFFDSAQERQALSLAINREALARVVMRNPDLAAEQLFPAAISGWSNRQLAPLEYDPQRARDLLNEAGWTLGDDGYLSRDDQRFEVTLRTYASWPDLPLLATAIQNQLAEVGIDLAISVGSYTEIPAGHQDGTLDLALITRSFSMVPDPLATVMEDYGPGGADWGAMNWVNDQAFGLIDQLSVSTDADARDAQLQQLTTLLHAELPTIPVVWSELAVAASKRLEGVYVDPYEQNYYLSDLRWVQE
ncbi:ABC transporter substrate-binding protein [Saccharospirillum sp. MSK14-1]|nr:ABC transporter substrate-binding protein [Saccharospirillum sp. MSK14-1]